MRRIVSSLLFSLVFVGFTASLEAQGLHARIQARKAEAEKPKAVKNAAEIQLQKSYQASYEDVLNWMKKSDFSVDFANSNKDNGIVASTIEVVKGGYSQTGRRLSVMLVKISDTETALRVAVTDHNRKKLFGADNWGDPQLNAEQTQAVVEQMKADLAVPVATQAQKQ